MEQIKFIKDYDTNKKGSIVECSKKNCERLIKEGYAKYVKDLKAPKPKKKPTKKKTTAAGNSKPDYKAFDKYISEYIGCEAFQRLGKMFIGMKKYNLTKTEAEKIINEKVSAQRNIEKNKRKEEAENIKEAKQEKRNAERAAIAAEKENQEAVKQALLDELEETWKTCDYELFVKVFDMDYKKAQHYFAERLLHKFYFITFKDNDDIIKYEDDEGVYAQKADIFIAQECKRRLGEKSTDVTVKEVTNSIKRSTYKERDILSQQPSHLKPFKNGLFNLITRELESFTPEHIFLNKIDIPYIPASACPKFKKFLQDTLPDKDSLIIQEWMGYCLLNDVRFQKALLCYGDGANGKSVLLKIIKFFLGNNNVTNIALQYLETNNFAPARLFGKAANIFFDLPNKALAQTSNFKTVVAGDPITGEKKGKDSFEFLPFCKMMFSCNEVPRSPDRTPAFFRRWIIIKFMQHFPEGDSRRIENLELQIINNEKEMQGLLIWALEGLYRLQENKKFTNNMSTAEIQDFWLRHSDSIAAFFLDMIYEDPNSQESKWDVFENYCSYCKVKGYTEEPQNAFWRRFKEICNFTEFKPKTESGSQTRYLKGIKLLERFIEKPGVLA